MYRNSLTDNKKALQSH